MIIEVGQQDFVSPFQSAIRAEYPILRQEQAQAILFNQTGLAQGQPRPVWRFSSTSGQWRVSLSQDFLALETTAYESRSDFISRLQAILEALSTHVKPAQVDRLGIRYIDRITGEELENIAHLVRAEMRGLAGSIASENLQHELTEAAFRNEKDGLTARWGLLPPGVTVDPAAIEPIEQPSWLLDIDMYSSEPFEFDVKFIAAESRRFAERIYTFFRWAITDEFLKRYGSGA